MISRSTESCGRFLSTPSARRATYRAKERQKILRISIHALREEGDASAGAAVSCSANFYPRPPRGGRHYKNNRCICAVAFLSTPSARRATSRPSP